MRSEDYNAAIMSVCKFSSSTPILDLERPLPRAKISTFLSSSAALIVVLLVICVFCGVLFPPLFALSIALVGFIIAAFHEAGHILAGWCVGMRFEGITVGPFIWKRNGKRTFQVRAAVDGGFAYMSLKRIRRVRRRLTIFILGGPLANFLCAVVAAGCFWVLFSRGSWLLLPLACVGLLSGIAAVVNLLPRTYGEHERDGLKLKKLYASYDSARQMIASYGVASLKSKGIPAPEWRLTWVVAATASRQKIGREADPGFVAYKKAISYRERAVKLEACLANFHKYNRAYRIVLLAEAAFHHGWVREDPEKAKEWLYRYLVQDATSPLSQLRAEVAVSFACRKFTETIPLLDRGIRIAHALSYADIEKLLCQWRDQVQDRISCAASSETLSVTAEGTSFRCPKCEWFPKKSDRWQCDCGHIWNTFMTQARCPKCEKQWPDTQCLECGEKAPIAEWQHPEPAMA